MNDRLEILCIEDFHLDAQLLDELLGGVPNFHYQFTRTVRVEDALSLLRKHRFDVVLLDLLALEPDGLNSLGRFNDVPVIVLADKRQEAQAIAAIHMGARQYLLKGEIDGQALVRAIMNVREQAAVRPYLSVQHDFRDSFVKLFRDTADAVFVVEIDSGIVLEANASAELLFGCPANMVTTGGLNFLQLWQNPGEWAVVRTLLQLGKPCVRQKWTMLTTGHRALQVVASFDLLPVAGKVCVLAVCTDRTECEEMKGRLVHAQQVEAISTLVGGIAHDFNNILAIITGYADLIGSSENLDDDARADLGSLQLGCRRARELVQQIHAFNRQNTMEKQSLQVSHLLKETLKLIRSSLPATIRIVQEIDAEGYMPANPVQMRQLFLGLCTNAFRAMGDTGALYVSLEDVPYADIPVAERESLQDMPHLRFTVRYECPSPQEQDTAPDQLGSVLLDIISEHKGCAHLCGTCGQHCGVRLYFPTILQAPGAVRTDLADITITPCNVMLVDDEKALLEVYGRLLSRLGYRIYTFSSAAEALQALEDKPDGFDVLITDLTMPAITGVQLIQMVRRRFPHLPAILCTGYSEMVEHIDTAALGIGKVLRKPLIVREMVLAIEESLKKA